MTDCDLCKNEFHVSLLTIMKDAHGLKMKVCERCAESSKAIQSLSIGSRVDELALRLLNLEKTVLVLAADRLRAGA